jgi:rRNA-processing protein FCF1
MKHMKQVLLDTNFIITCMKQKIDFFEEITLIGIPIIIPEEVIGELEKLKQDQALRLLKKEQDKFSKIKLLGKNVDNAIINFASKNPETIIATLDREIKTKIKNRKMIIRDKKQLEII